MEELGGQIGKRFARAEPRRRALAYIKGLLSSIERKNGWELAEQAGERTPYGMQHLLGRAQWDAEQVRDDLRSYVVEHLGDAEAVLIVDETGFIKKGEHSAGVQRQYSGTAGRIENCQIGVFLAYCSGRGHTFVDRALYLPRSWSEQEQRCREAAVPESLEFATKPMLARQMLQRAFAAGVPARWVTGDCVYGSDRQLRRFLEDRQMTYVLAVTSNCTIRFPLPTDGAHTAQSLANSLPRQAWKRRSAGAGSKGARRYDWALQLVYRNESDWGHPGHTHPWPSQSTLLWPSACLPPPPSAPGSSYLPGASTQ